jgi:hypothetical protein
LKLDGQDHDGVGQEAIEMLLQIMENERENLGVILAGYKDKMEDFFTSNPGMGSRIAHHIDFPDFNAEELMGIAHIMAAGGALHVLRRGRGCVPRIPRGRGHPQEPAFSDQDEGMYGQGSDSDGSGNGKASDCSEGSEGSEGKASAKDDGGSEKERRAPPAAATERLALTPDFQWLSRMASSRKSANRPSAPGPTKTTDAPPALPPEPGMTTLRTLTGSSDTARRPIR